MPRRSNEQIIADLIEEGANLLSQAYTLGQSLTETYRRLAGVIVDLRKRFPNSQETGPDWRGTTQAYREAVAKMYEASGVEPDSVSNMQAAIRYHIGNVLRERLSAEELAAAGLKAEGPLQRSRNGNGNGRDDRPENEEEWFEDTITTLKSIEDDHPEVVILDLRNPSNDVLPMLHKCLTIMQTAHSLGAPPKTRDACVAVLDQVLAEAAAFRTEASQARAPAKKAAAKKAAARAPA